MGVAFAGLLLGSHAAWAADAEEADEGATAAPTSEAPVLERSQVDEPPTLEELPDVLVTAPTLTPRPLQETAAPINAITEKDLVRKQPRSFSDAIWYQPGLWNTQGSTGQMGTPVIRGAQGNQVLLLIDGVRVSNTLFTIGPGSDWDLIDMDWVDHIEVVRSPDAVLYGTQGIGGATALYSGWPIDYTRCGVHVGGRARGLYTGGGENLWHGGLEGHVATPRFRMVLQGSWTDSRNYVGGGDVGEEVPTKFATQGASLRMEGRLGRYDTLGLSVFAIQKQWPGSWLHPSRDYENWSDREIGILRWNHTCPFVLADEMELRLGIVRNDRVRWRKDSYSRDGIYVLTPQADLILHKRLGCHTLTYGLHAHQDRIEAPLATTQGSIKEIPDGYLLTEGIYVQDEWQVTRRLRVTGGLRFDLSQVETNPEAATTDPLIDPSEIDLSRDDSAWTGKLAVYYRLTDAVGLTTNLARGYRFPGPNDLASFRQAPDEIQVGNPDLNPEYSTVWDAGVHFNRPKWRGSVGGFVAWFDDLIIGRSGTWNGMTYLDRNMNGMQDPDEDFFIRENAGSATFYGVEASAEWEFWPCFTAFGNFTWWHGDISPAPTEPIGVPTNGTLGVRYGNVGDFFWAELACHMVARFDDIPPDFYNDEAFFFKDPQDSSSGPYRNDHSMPGYSIFDLRGGVKVSKHLSLTFGVENLFDKKYRSFGSRRFGNGATVYVGAKADL